MAEVPWSVHARRRRCGFYCNFTRSPPTDDRIEQLLGARDYSF